MGSSFIFYLMISDKPTRESFIAWYERFSETKSMDFPLYILQLLLLLLCFFFLNMYFDPIGHLGKLNSLLFYVKKYCFIVDILKCRFSRKCGLCFSNTWFVKEFLRGIIVSYCYLYKHLTIDQCAVLSWLWSVCILITSVLANKHF